MPHRSRMGVQAGGMGAPAWIDTGVPQVAGRVQRHHVGRCLVAVAPEGRDRDPALELGHALVGATQPSAALQRTHGHRDLRWLEPGIIEATPLASASVP